MKGAKKEAPRVGDSPEREPWELAQNQPGQVNTLSEENNLDQSTEMEEAAGWENLPLGPPKGRSSMQINNFTREFIKKIFFFFFIH